MYKIIKEGDILLCDAFACVCLLLLRSTSAKKLIAKTTLITYLKFIVLPSQSRALYFLR